MKAGRRWRHQVEWQKKPRMLCVTNHREVSISIGDGGGHHKTQHKMQKYSERRYRNNDNE